MQRFAYKKVMTAELTAAFFTTKKSPNPNYCLFTVGASSELRSFIVVGLRVEVYYFHQILEFRIELVSALIAPAP